MREFCQNATSADRVCRGVHEVLASRTTEYQECTIWRSETLGTCISIDGDLQSTEMDLPTYHEALVHPAMLAAEYPETVLVCGGGEGATIREVMRHRSVRRVVMVDIDAGFVDLCREHVPEWSAGAFDDPRLELLHEDVFDYVESTEQRFDAVIGDLTDLLEEVAPGRGFHTEAFYSSLYRLLNPGGTLSTQASALALYDHETHLAIRNNVRDVFGDARSYRVPVDSFFVAWSFVLAKKGGLAPAADLGRLFSLKMRESGLELAHHDAGTLAAAFVHNRRIQSLLEG
ncbi:MAG: methyltransferase domain-containing protein [Desulfatibacillaceae bacterium]